MSFASRLGLGAGLSLRTLVSHLLFVGLAGCSTIGPATIEAARTPYNESIQDTSRTQTLLNIVRVSRGEMPLFVDITEIDAGYSLSNTASGGPSNLVGPVNGALALGTTYSDAPTIRYLPVAGAALIAQLSQPITPQAISNLIDSGWSPSAVLTFTVDNLTANVRNYSLALNAILALDSYGVLTISALPVPSVSKKGATPNGDNGTMNNAKDAPYTLALYLRDDHASATVLCDRSELAQSKNPAGPGKAYVEQLWHVLEEIYGQWGKIIIIGVKPTALSQWFGSKISPQVLHTRSALGVLKTATEMETRPGEQNFSTVTFLSPEEARDLRQQTEDYRTQAKTRKCSAPGMYLRKNVDVKKAAEEGDSSADFINAHLDQGLSAYIANNNLHDQSSVNLNHETELARRRVLVIVEVTDTPPAGAYAQVFYAGKWYSIRDDDLVSKKNFSLLSLISTIQAIPNDSGGLNRSINVGAPR